MANDWEAIEHPSRPAAARLAVHQGQGLLRHDHPEGVRRAGLFRVRAFASDHQALDALRHDRGDGDGAELARARRASRSLRHRRAEEPLPAASRQGHRHSLLRAHQSVRGLGCGRDPGLRVRAVGRARRQARARPVGDVGQALHHAGAGRHAPRTRVPRLRSRQAPGRQGGPRHHVRARSHVASGRTHRPPAHAAQLGIPERADLGPRRLHSDGLGHRRPTDDRQGLADADGMPGGRPRHLAAVVQHGAWASHRTRRRRLCACSHAIQGADRQVRGRRGSARPHRRQPLHDGRDPQADGCGHRRGREAGGARGDREVPHHRTRTPDDQRRHGRDRRQGHHDGPVELPRRRVHAASGRDHGRRREHPHAQPHHLRAGRHPLPSVPAEGNERDARARPPRGVDGVRRRAVRPRSLYALQSRAHVCDGHHRIAFRARER